MTAPRSMPMLAGLLAAGIALGAAASAGAAPPDASHAVDPEIGVVAERVRAMRGLAAGSALVVENRGQLDSDAAYYTYAGGARVDFGVGRITFTFVAAEADPDGPVRRPGGLLTRVEGLTPRQALSARGYLSGTRVDVVRLDLAGPAATVRPKARERAETLVSYFRGLRPSWITAIPTYRGIVYENVWQGVDLVFEGRGGELTGRLVVRPGADPSDIEIAWSAGGEAHGAGPADGSNAASRVRALLEAPPSAWQVERERRTPVDVIRVPGGARGADQSYAERAEGHVRRMTFRTGPFDPSRALEIETVQLAYGGFLGTAGPDRGLGIAVDALGAAYVSGQMQSATEPRDQDAYVAKVAPDGRSLDYLAIIGGDYSDSAFDVAVDAAGAAFVTGCTVSDEDSFPVIVGPDLSFNGSADVMLAKVAPSGTDLEYAGYLGGELIDGGEGIAIDDRGQVYVTGFALSSEATFPVKIGPDVTFNGEVDAFVTKVVAVPSGPDVHDNIVYSGYLGGDLIDTYADERRGYSSGHVAVDATGAAYLSHMAGSTEATFPDGHGMRDIPGPDRTFNGYWDAVVAKVRPDGSGFAYAGFVGGTRFEQGLGIGVDAGGNAYLAGWTDSDEESFPVVAGPDLTFNGGLLDAFVSKISADGSRFVYSGYLGGAAEDSASGLVADRTGRAYVIGFSMSGQDTFPAVAGPDLTRNDDGVATGDAIVCRLKADPTSRMPADNYDFCGFIGGLQNDQSYWVAYDDAGNTYVAGDTRSDDTTFPGGAGTGSLPGPGSKPHGGYDAFVVKVGDAPLPAASPSSQPTVPPVSATPPPVDGRGSAFLPLAMRGQAAAAHGRGVATAASTERDRPPTAASTTHRPGGAWEPRGARPSRSEPEWLAASGRLAEADPREDVAEVRPHAVLSAPMRGGRLHAESPYSAARSPMVAPGANALLVSPHLLGLQQISSRDVSYDDYCDVSTWFVGDAFDIVLGDDGVCSYVITATAAVGSLSAFMSTVQPSDDFVLETTVQRKGNQGSVGLTFGSGPTRRYAFIVTHDQRYLLGVHGGGSWRVVASGRAPGVDATEPTRLAVIVRPDEVRLLANNGLLQTVADSGPHGGRVGPYVESGDGLAPSVGVFDYIRVGEVTGP